MPFTTVIVDGILQHKMSRKLPGLSFQQRVMYEVYIIMKSKHDEGELVQYTMISKTFLYFRLVGIQRWCCGRYIFRQQLYANLTCPAMYN